MWIYDGHTPEGEINFLVRCVYNNDGGAERYALRSTPLVTNQSYEARLNGWCGETNNVSAFAEGLARVTKRSANGRRALVSRVTRPSEIRAFLTSEGYPELA